MTMNQSAWIYKHESIRMDLSAYFYQHKSIRMNQPTWIGPNDFISMFLSTSIYQYAWSITTLTWKRHGHSDCLSDGQIRRGFRMAVLWAHLRQVRHNDAQLTSIFIIKLEQDKNKQIQKNLRLTPVSILKLNKQIQYISIYHLCDLKT